MTADPPTIDAAFSGTLGNFVLDVAFRIPAHGVSGLFGPSGCGKTTVLRGIAGLSRLSGHLRVGDEVWQDDAAGRFWRPHLRPVGYVFQEASLFPHLSVQRNLLFGARRAFGGGGGTFDFDDVVGLLGVGALLDRSPITLSGGERQRVAIGRALLSQPRLLLMDEPLAALDRFTKEEILPYLETLHEALSIPIIYVSHDLAELERLADTLVLFDRGRVRAVGPLTELEADPSLPLLQGPEAAVTLAGRIAAIDEDYALTHFAVNGGTLVVPGRIGGIGQQRRLRIRASDVSFARVRPVDTTILNCLPARVRAITPQADGRAQVNVVAALGDDGSGAEIISRITRKSRDALALEPGERIFVQIKSVALLAMGAARTIAQG